MAGRSPILLATWAIGAIVSRTGAATVPTFLLLGQSNMAGYGLVSELPDSLLRPDTTASLFCGTDTAPAWGPLRPGHGVDPARFGPELALGPRLARATGTEVALVKLAVGATSLAHEWLPPSAGGPGPLYAIVSPVLSAARAARPGDSLDLRGIFWMQGESDALRTADARAYRARLHALILDLRQDLSNGSATPFVLGLIDDQPVWPFAGPVRSAQRDQASLHAGAAWVETSGLATDGTHYRTAGTLELGRRLAESWVGIARLPAPGPLPPSRAPLGLHLASGELLLRLPDDPEPGTVARVLELDGTLRADRPLVHRHTLLTPPASARGRVLVVHVSSPSTGHALRWIPMPSR